MNNNESKYLLKEDVDQTRVIDAIKRRKEVRAYYSSDDDPKGSGERLIQPVAFGLSKSGNPVVRAFQPFGDTKTKVPHWKLFRLDRFTSWNILKNRTFKEPPGMQYGEQGSFNENGDKGMSEVYVVADFKGANDRYEHGGLKKYNQEVHASKVAQNPYYDLQKQMKNKVFVGPDAMKNVQNWKPNDDMKRYLNGASAEDMAKTTSFGDENFTQTSAPILKGDVNSAPLQQNTNRNAQQGKTYANVAMNGPVIKGMEVNKQNNTDETSDDIDNNED